MNYLHFFCHAYIFHDGFEIDSSVLLFENQRVHEVSNKKLPEAVYTTGPVAEVRFKKTLTEGLKLKIQKVINIF